MQNNGIIDNSKYPDEEKEEEDGKITIKKRKDQFGIFKNKNGKVLGIIKKKTMDEYLIHEKKQKFVEYLKLPYNIDYIYGVYLKPKVCGSVYLDSNIKRKEIRMINKKIKMLSSKNPCLLRKKYGLLILIKLNINFVIFLLTTVKHSPFHKK